jgi:cobalt-precorrin-5B (C1)-methyltransferase
MGLMLRTGFTTGACAAAAAKAAVRMLCGDDTSNFVEIGLPDGSRARFSVLALRMNGMEAEASVRKDAGDDPDVTHEMSVVAAVHFVEGGEVLFAAGEGVGTVTKPGLSVPRGEPAINPGPRRMISQAVREVTPRGVLVRVSIPGGGELAARTFNPRLGIEGGLSILGTTGIVRPFSVPAMEASLKCALDVAAASGVREPVLVPGAIGERAARKNLRVDPTQIIQVSNHWGFMLDAAAALPFDRVLILGHPGKLAKLIEGEWDTHSSHSGSAAPIVARIAAALLPEPVPESATVEGVFEALSAAGRAKVAAALAGMIAKAIRVRFSGEKEKEVAVALINMAGDILGSDGDLSPWL